MLCICWTKYYIKGVSCSYLCMYVCYGKPENLLWIRLLRKNTWHCAKQSAIFYPQNPHSRLPFSLCNTCRTPYFYVADCWWTKVKIYHWLIYYLRIGWDPATPPTPKECKGKENLKKSVDHNLLSTFKHLSQLPLLCILGVGPLPPNVKIIF
jgi:hypothetical protein